jgi:virginiamycin B lyase
MKRTVGALRQQALKPGIGLGHPIEKMKLAKFRPPYSQVTELKSRHSCRSPSLFGMSIGRINAGVIQATTGDMKVWDAPKGRGPYGMTGTPKGDIWFVSLAGSYLANVDLETGAATVYEPPTKDQGARRVWSDSKGRLWVSEWNSGNVSVYDPIDKSWKQWRLPGERPRTYAVWVDPDDKVWLSEWAANAIVRFDPATERFESFPSNRPNSNVRQMLGRKGETWIAESGPERIRVIRHAARTN